MMMVPRTLNNLESLCDKAILTLAAILLCIEIALVTADVFTRYVLQLPLAWSAELARYCMVWSALLGSSVLVRRNGHLRVTLIDRWLPPRGMRILHLFVAVVSMVFFTILLISGCVLVFRTTGQTSASISGLPMSVVYVVIPVSAYLMLRNAILSLQRGLEGKGSIK